jgi:hypothetical protein
MSILGGAVERMSIVGSELDVWVLAHTSVLASASKLNLTTTQAPRCRAELRDVVGSVVAEIVELDVAHSDLRITASGVEGQIDSSWIRMDAATFGRTTAVIDGSVIVISEQRAGSSPSSRHKSGERPGRSSVVLVHPGVQLDAWWSQQQDLLSIGGCLDGTPSSWPTFRGVTIARRALERSNDYASLHVHEGEGFVLHGSGPSWQQALRRYNDLLRLSPRARGEIAAYCSNLEGLVATCAPEVALASSFVEDLKERLGSFVRDR